jgi:hypothetical protein
MSEPPETLTIGVLADAAGVNVETIRFYQRKGLMQEPDRPLGGIRRYGGRIWHACASSNRPSDWASAWTRSRTC